jgi:hypothetical protein
LSAPGYNRSLSRSESRIRVLTQIEKFLADHLPPRSH